MGPMETTNKKPPRRTVSFMRALAFFLFAQALRRTCRLVFAVALRPMPSARCAESRWLARIQYYSVADRPLRACVQFGLGPPEIVLNAQAGGFRCYP